MFKYLFLGIGLLTICFLPNSTYAAVSSWQKGMSLVPRWDTDYGSDSFKAAIDDLSKTNINYITLVIPLYQSNPYSTDIHAGWNTPTDDSLIAGISYIHSRGIKVNVKPHLESYDGQWRAHINPDDRNAWFGSYGFHIKKYAALAAQHGVEEITIGTELINMSADDANGTNTAHWLGLIGDVRNIYSGLLTYSANWGGPGWTDEKNRITFWHALDSIGISAYFPLPASNPTVEAFKAEWNSINMNDISKLHERFQKPIIFTEVGYRSIDWAHWAPFNFWDGGTISQEEQANLYEALFSYWNTHDFMQGVHLWNWSTDPSVGGSGNSDFTPNDKLAEGTMTQWFGSGGSPNPPPPPPPSGPLTFTTTLSNAPTSAQIGQSFTLSLTVKNETTNATGLIVDVELYGSDGQKLHQEFFEQQSFASQEAKQYTTSYTPTTSGNLTVKVGVFNQNWSTNYHWNDAAGTIQVGAGNEPPPPPSSVSINIWWPTENAHIPGVQPFKAMLEGRDIDAYSMAWQVDGGGENIMSNNFTDYPHKEQQVDLANWTWHGAGPYTLTFIAKDQGGNTIASRSIQIFSQ